MNENTPDIRWRQRFDNYRKAYRILTQIVAQADLNETEQMGLVQAFEMTFELGWNVLRDYLSEVGGEERLVGSRDTIRRAFREGLITAGELWMKMVDDRNLTVHTYSEELRDRMIADIREKYVPCFQRLLSDFERRALA